MSHTVLPSLHGSQHHPNGSDKLPGGIFFDYTNTGTYLLIIASDHVTIGAPTITLNDQGGVINTTGNGTINFHEAGFNVFADNILIDAHGGTPKGITIYGYTVLRLSTVSDLFDIHDHNNNPIWSIDDTGAVTKGTVDGGTP
jgi:hypothetical protein